MRADHYLEGMVAYLITSSANFSPNFCEIIMTISGADERE